MITRDINFFAPYVKEQERSTGQLILTATATVVMIGISGTLGYNIFQLNALQTEKDDIEKAMAKTSFVEQYDKAKAVVLEKNLLGGFNEALMTVHDGIIDRRIIDPTLIRQINKTIPQGANLTNTSIASGGAITLGVKSKTSKEAADMLYNLNKLPIIENAFTSGLNPVGPDEWTFTITCNLEEVYDEN